MTLSRMLRGVGTALGALFFVGVPILHPDGTLWVVAAAATVTVYEGLRARIVYAAAMFIAVTELVYGGQGGSLTIAYVCSVILLMALRRSIALPAWGAQDGWSVTDALRTIIVSWILCAGVVLLGLVIGDLLYGYDQVWARMRSLWNVGDAGTLLAFITVLSIVLRRLAIPFRREILFGS